MACLRKLAIGVVALGPAAVAADKTASLLDMGAKMGKEALTSNPTVKQALTDSPVNQALGEALGRATKANDLKDGLIGQGLQLLGQPSTEVPEANNICDNEAKAWPQSATAMVNYVNWAKRETSPLDPNAFVTSDPPMLSNDGGSYNEFMGKDGKRANNKGWSLMKKSIPKERWVKVVVPEGFRKGEEGLKIKVKSGYLKNTGARTENGWKKWKSVLHDTIIEKTDMDNVVCLRSEDSILNKVRKNIPLAWRWKAKTVEAECTPGSHFYLQMWTRPQTEGFGSFEFRNRVWFGGKVVAVLAASVVTMGTAGAIVASANGASVAAGFSAAIANGGAVGAAAGMTGNPVTHSLPVPVMGLYGWFSALAAAPVARIVWNMKNAWNHRELKSTDKSSLGKTGEGKEEVTGKGAEELVGKGKELIEKNLMGKGEELIGKELLGKGLKLLG